MPTVAKHLGTDQPTLFNVETRPRRDSNAAPYRTMVAMEPASRSADPLASFQAADSLGRRGISGRQRLQVYHALRANQGCTSAELARIMRCDRYTPSRRLPELRRAGWVCNGRRRRCSVSLVVSDTWWIVRGWREGRNDPKPVPPEGHLQDSGRSQEDQAAPARPAQPAARRVLTVPERQALREEMAASGNESAAKVTAAMVRRSS